MPNRRFNFVFKFKRNITYPGQFEIYRTFVKAKFRKRLELSQFVGNSPINDRFRITVVIFPSIHKDAVPSIQQNMVVYEYVCRCDCRYVGCTSLRLEERINQHVPNFIRRKLQPTKILPERKCTIRSIATYQQCVSAIGLNLMQNPECATQYSNDRFSILAKPRSVFHLSVLKATYIKISKPILCRQKEFVYSLHIFH